MATTSSISGIRAGFTWDAQKTTNTGSNTSNGGSFSYSKSYATSAAVDPPVNTVTKFHVDQFTLAASANKLIDLAGVLLDAFGDAVTFTKVRYIFLEMVVDELAESSGVSLDMSGTGVFGSYLDAPGAATKFLIQQGGSFQLCAGSGLGYSVTGTTADLVRIINLDASNSATVRVCVAGI